MKIIATSDVHGYIFPVDYSTDSRVPTGLFSMRESFPKDALKLDLGDVLQGSPLASFIKKKDYPEFFASVMNDIGYDYVTLGNHDFNYGRDYLKRYIDNLDAEVLCANVIDHSNSLKISPYKIIERDGLKIALVGLVTHWVNIWEREENIEGLEFLNPISVIEGIRDEIKNCDLKICMYHGGIERDINTLELLSNTDENMGYRIMEMEVFDIVLTGHQHMPIESFYAFSSLLTQSPYNGTGFIEIDVEGKTFNSKIVKPSVLDFHIDDKYLKIDKECNEFLDIKIGELDQSFTPLSHLDAAIKSLTNDYSLANFINKIQKDYSKSDISVTSFANEIKGFKTDVTFRDVLSTYRFPNVLSVIEITKDELISAIEHNFEYLLKNNDEYYINNRYLLPKEEHYNFDFFYGLNFSYEYVDGKFKIKSLTFDDDVDENRIKLALNNYRLSGAGGFSMYRGKDPIFTSNDEISTIIAEYIKNNSN